MGHHELWFTELLNNYLAAPAQAVLKMVGVQAAKRADRLTRADHVGEQAPVARPGMLGDRREPVKGRHAHALLWRWPLKLRSRSRPRGRREDGRALQSGKEVGRGVADPIRQPAELLRREL